MNRKAVFVAVLGAMTALAMAPVMAATSTSALSSFFFGSTQNSSSPSGAGQGAAQMDAARIAIANGDNSFGAKSAAAKDANCTAITTSTQQVRTAALKRRAPVSPVDTIRGTTCFVDVFSTVIPQIGGGFVSNLVNQLVQRSIGPGCNSSNSFWSAITKSAQTGNVASLLGPAITAGTKYVAQEFTSPAPTRIIPMPTVEPYVPTTVPAIQPAASQIAVPGSGWGSAGYAMCGNIAAISESVGQHFLQASGSSVSSYQQATMSRGVGYSLSFTTGPDVYDTGIPPHTDPNMLMSTIAARITNNNTSGIIQELTISPDGCDFSGAKGVTRFGTAPALSFIVTQRADLPAGIMRLAPNTRYYVNYHDSDGTQFTCPTGATCQFQVDFVNTVASTANIVPQ